MKKEVGTATQWITVKGPEHEVPVFVAQPENEESLPAIILIHEIFAVNDHIKDVAMRFSNQGFRVFAPDLFACSAKFPQQPEARNDLATMREVWSEIPDSTLIDNLKAVLLAVKKTPNVLADAVGTMGFCMGGAIAFMFASSTDELAWAVDFYGRIKYPSLNKEKPKHPIEYANSQTPAILGVFAGQDDLITPEHRELFRQTLESLNVPFELKVFENCPHAFFNNTREHYKKEEASMAWQMALEFMQKHSRIKPKRN